MVSKMYYKEELSSWEFDNDLKGKRGVYMLLSRDLVVLYVGRSKDLLSRLRVHKADKDKIFQHISVLLIDDIRKTEETESCLIKIHKPLYNKQIPKTDRTNDEIFDYISFTYRELAKLGENISEMNHVFKNKYYGKG